MTKCDSTLATDFRDLMASVCTPVSVVTAMDGDRPHGTTVSAFTSLSMSPPMVLVSLDRRSDLLGYVRTRRRLGLNVLASGQSAVAGTFATKGREKFDNVEWSMAAGVPRIHGVAGWLAGDVTELIDGGDHVVALVMVTDLVDDTADPLTYHRRAFGTHVAL